MVIRVARAFAASPIEGLLAAGVLIEDDLDLADARAALVVATDEDLLAELGQRLAQPHREHPALHGPMPEVPLRRAVNGR